MLKRISRTSSSLPAVLALALALLFGAAPVLAQNSSSNQGGSQPDYAKQFAAAKQAAKQGQLAEKNGNVEKAVSNYEKAYRGFASVSKMAKKEGSVENANLAKQMAAQLAYRAGRVLHNDGQSQAAVKHFKFGQQVAPPSYTKNTQGLKAAQSATKQAPVVKASQALRNGNARKALQLLSEVEEQNGTTYFYQALAHQELGNTDSAVSYAERALDAGGISSTKQGQLHLLIGEERMRQGDDAAARTAFEQAIRLGSSQVSDRAKALMEQL